MPQVGAFRNFPSETANYDLGSIYNLYYESCLWESILNIYILYCLDLNRVNPEIDMGNFNNIVQHCLTLTLSMASTRRAADPFA